MAYSKPTDIDPYVRALIRHNVRRIVNCSGYTPADREDLQQELALAAHVAAPKYNPARAAKTTFFDRVLRNQITTLLRAASAAKRDRGHEQPLGDHEVSISALSDVDLKLDVKTVVAALPFDLQRLAVLFMEGSEAHVIRRSGLTRQRVRGGRHRIGRHLRDAGLAPARGGRHA